MPIAGEAVVRVRVSSSNLRRDIRDAVNDGFRGASGDVDKAGQDAGDRYNAAVAKGLRQDERLRLAGERLNLAIARGLRDDARLQLDAEKHGARVQESIERGLRDQRKIDLASDRLNAQISDSIARGMRDDRRLDLAGERLAQQIHASIERGLRDDRRLDLAAERDAARMQEAFARGLRDNRRLDIAADSLTERMSQNVERGFRDNERLRIAGERLNQSIADGIRRDRALDLAIEREARMAGQNASRSFGNGFNRDRNSLKRLFSAFGSDMGKELASEFRLGIGAGRPGPAIVSMLALAAPSALGSAAALGVAMAGALTAAVSSTLLSGGLLAAAFASGAESLTEGKDIWSAAGTRAGTLIADGMAAGFTASARTFADTILPALEGPLTASGQAFGRMFEGLAATLALPENLERMGSILEQNVRFIDQFSAGLSGLTTAFLILFDASRPMIELVGSTFQRFGEWAASALTAAEANGTLATVMDNITRLADAMFGWLSAIGPAFGDWLLNLDVEGIITGWESFGTIIGDVGRIFGQIADGAGPHFVQIMDNIHGILTNLVESGTIQVVADRIGMLLERFTAFIEELTSSDLGATIGAIGLALLLFGGFLSPIVTLLSALGSAVMAVAGALGTAAVPVLLIAGLFAAVWTQSERFRESISELVTAVGGKFTEIWDKISPAVGRLVENFLLFASALGDRLAPIIEFLTPLFVGLFDIIGTVLGFIIDQVSEFFAFLGSILSGDFEAAWEHFKNMLSNLWTFIGDIFTKIRLFIGEVFSGLWTLVVSIWQSMWAVVSDTAVNVWNNIWNFLVGIWNAIAGFFSDIWNDIVADLQETGEGLRAWWDNLWQWTGERLSAAWNWIFSIFEGAYNWITSTIRSVGDTIQSIWNSVWTWVGNALAAAWNWIIGILSGAWNWITSTIRSVGNTIQSIWNSVWTWVGDTIRNIWNGITSWLSGVWNGLIGTASSAWNSVTSAIRSAVDSVASFLSGIWTGISNTASSIWNSIAGIASRAWNAVYDAIVQPVIDAYNAVVGWISDIADAVGGLLSDLGGWVSEANDKLGQVVTAQAEATVAGTAIGGGAGMGTSAQLAQGGVIRARPGGLTATIGEGGRDERVEPLDSQGLSRRDRALITQIVGSMVSSQSGGGSTTVQVMIGDHELGNYIARVVEHREDELARRVERRRRR